MSDARAGGAANERTALAWNRTALALMATVLATARIVLDRLGVLAVVLTALAVPLAVAVVVAATRRYRASMRTDSPAPDARLLAMVSVLIVVLAVTEIAYVYRG
jgi:uncharacterized membrane protein YidH (DUF202 family)